MNEVLNGGGKVGIFCLVLNFKYENDLMFYR